MTEPAVLYELRGQVAWITLNRPQALNALSPELMQGLNMALDRVEAEETARAAVLTGAGRAFCAGGDLKFFRQTLGTGERSQFMAFLREIQAVMRRLEMLPLPTIAAVNGAAVAGGLELVLCCDLVIASETARIGDGHANFGIIPGGGGSVRLPRKIPVAIAKQLLFTGELLPAAAWARWGLVNQVVPAAELQSAVTALTAAISRNSPLGLRWMKQLVNDGLEQPQDTALRAELYAFESYAASEDILEGLAAFEEKRQPQFRGR